eukprot:gene29823-51872_t
MIVTEPAPLMAIGGVDGNGLYGRQTLRGNLAYGGGPHEWLEVSETGPAVRPTTPLMRNLAKRVAELLPKAAHLRVIRSWAGVIEITPDGRPVIDRLTSPDNVVVATMSGVGFGLSPASGHAIADLVLEGRCTFADIDKLGIGRFAGLSPDWRAERGWAAVSAPVAGDGSPVSEKVRRVAWRHIGVDMILSDHVVANGDVLHYRPGHAARPEGRRLCVKDNATGQQDKPVASFQGAPHGG